MAPRAKASTFPAIASTLAGSLVTPSGSSGKAPPITIGPAACRGIAGIGTTRRQASSPPAFARATALPKRTGRKAKRPGPRLSIQSVERPESGLPPSRRQARATGSTAVSVKVKS